MLTDREVWTTVHGIIFGAIFLIGFTGSLTALWAMKPAWIKAETSPVWAKRLSIVMWVLTITLWLTVLTGTYIVYPWYRAMPPAGADLSLFPRSFLLGSPDLSFWHTFGMEWKEHIAWVAPMAMTVASYVVTRYGRWLTSDNRVRQATIVFVTVAFVAAAVAGLFGALITRAAPVQ